RPFDQLPQQPTLESQPVSRDLRLPEVQRVASDPVHCAPAGGLRPISRSSTKLRTELLKRDEDPSRNRSNHAKRPRSGPLPSVPSRAVRYIELEEPHTRFGG